MKTIFDSLKKTAKESTHSADSVARARFIKESKNEVKQQVEKDKNGLLRPISEIKSELKGNKKLVDGLTSAIQTQGKPTKMDSSLLQKEREKATAQLAELRKLESREVIHDTVASVAPKKASAITSKSIGRKIAESKETLQSNVKKTVVEKNKQAKQLKTDVKSTYKATKGAIFGYDKKEERPEEAIAIENELKSMTKKKTIKANATKLASSATSEVKQEVTQLKNTVAENTKSIKDSKKALKNSVDPANIKSLATGKTEEEKGKLKNQVNSEKLKIKQVASDVKMPNSVELKSDKNGTTFTGVPIESFSEKLTSLAQNKGDLRNPTMKAPALNYDPRSLAESKIVSGKNSLKNPSTGLTEDGVRNLVTGKLETKVDALKDRGEKTLTAPIKSANALLGSPISLNTPTIYSEKLLQKIKDSIGISKFQELYQKANGLSSKKDVAPSDFMSMLNVSSSMSGSSGMLEKGKQARASSANPEALSKGFDPVNGKVPSAFLTELEPLAGNQLDSKLLKAVDSVRKARLKKQRFKVSQHDLGPYEEIIFKRKPRFFDKAYADLLMGLVSNSSSTIYQASPSMGYHFLPLFSVGLGPSILIQKQDTRTLSKFGFRSFLKYEVFKQNGYVEAEYQVNPYQLSANNLWVSKGSLLSGIGIVRPFFGKVAANVSLLYKVSDANPNVGASRWVFRLGLSTVSNPDK